MTSRRAQRDKRRDDSKTSDTLAALEQELHARQTPNRQAKRAADRRPLTAGEGLSRTTTRFTSRPTASTIDSRRRFTNLAEQAKPWYRISNLAPNTAGQSAAELYIYDEISWFGITAADLVRELTALNVDILNVRINSPGGDAFDGIAIKNSLAAHPATVNVVIDGLAASAASVIAMAGDTITMMPGSQMMIHNASAFCMGQATDMRSLADLLDQLSANIAGIYAYRSGRDASEHQAQMDAETWFNGDQAVEAGLADSVDVVKSSGNGIVPGAADPFDGMWDKAAKVCNCGPKGYRMVAKDDQHDTACPALGTFRPRNLPSPVGVQYNLVSQSGSPCEEICEPLIDSGPFEEDDLPDIPGDTHPNCDCELEVAYGVDNAAPLDPFMAHFTTTSPAAVAEADQDDSVHRAMREAFV